MLLAQRSCPTPMATVDVTARSQLLNPEALLYGQGPRARREQQQQEAPSRPRHSPSSLLAYSSSSSSSSSSISSSSTRRRSGADESRSNSQSSPTLPQRTKSSGRNVQQQQQQAQSAAVQALRRAAGSRYDELVSRRRSPPTKSPATFSPSPTALGADQLLPFPFRSPSPLPPAPTPATAAVVARSLNPLLPRGVTAETPQVRDMVNDTSDGNRRRRRCSSSSSSGSGSHSPRADVSALLPVTGLRGLPSRGDVVKTLGLDPTSVAHCVTRLYNNSSGGGVGGKASSSPAHDRSGPRSVLAHRTFSGSRLVGADGRVLCAAGKAKKVVRFLGVTGP